tara:strand:+ start:368 stop:868 length:501 start_codon:yes stop_codon:yes gene_type:complete
MIRGTEIRQQLRNQTFEDLLVTSINTVGDRIYPDDMAVLDMEALTQIVDTWRATHAVTYGNVLPNTGAIAEGISDGGGLEPLNNQVIDVVAVSMANAGGAPVEVQLKLGDLVIFGGAIAPNGTTTSTEIGAIFPLTISKGLALKFGVTSGTASDFSAKVAYQYRSV